MLISGYAADDLLRRGSASEEYAFLQKPFTPTELAAAVHNLLGR